MRVWSYTNLIAYGYSAYARIPVEKPFLHGVVVEGAVNVHWSNGGPVDPAAIEQVFSVELALCTLLMYRHPHQHAQKKAEF